MSLFMFGKRPAERRRAAAEARVARMVASKVGVLSEEDSKFLGKFILLVGFITTVAILLITDVDETADEAFAAGFHFAKNTSEQYGDEVLKKVVTIANAEMAKGTVRNSAEAVIVATAEIVKAMPVTIPE